MITYFRKQNISSQICFAMLVFAVSLFLVGTAYDALNLKTFLVSTFGGAWENPLSQILCTYLIALPIFMLVMHFIPNSKPKKKADGLSISTIALFTLAGLGISILSQQFFQVVVSPTTTASDTNGVGFGVILPGIFTAFMAGFGEEFITRKMLFQKMAGYSGAIYVVVSGLTFGLLHPYIAQIGHCFFGFALAYIYLKTRNYILVALIHTAADLLSMALFPFLQAIDPSGTFKQVAAILFVLTVSICLIFALIKYRKKIVLYIKNLPYRAIFVNAGMILYLIYSFTRIGIHLFQ